MYVSALTVDSGCLFAIFLTIIRPLNTSTATKYGFCWLNIKSRCQTWLLFVVAYGKYCFTFLLGCLVTLYVCDFLINLSTSAWETSLFTSFACRYSTSGFDRYAGPPAVVYSLRSRRCTTAISSSTHRGYSKDVFFASARSTILAAPCNNSLITHAYTRKH